MDNVFFLEEAVIADEYNVFIRYLSINKGEHKMLELLEIALIVVVLVIIGFAWYIINYLLIKLPEQQKDIL